MSAAIVLPWRSTGCSYRQRHVDHLRDLYGALGYPVLLGDNEGVWNVSAARNAGVRESGADIVAVIDADTYIPLEQVDESIRLAAERYSLVKPFSLYGYLTEDATERYYAGSMDEPEWIHTPTAHFIGGAYVMRRDLWDAVGGFDEEFVGYGGEDNAFQIACERTLNPTGYVEGLGYHLYHPANRQTTPQNMDRLYALYWK